MFQGMNNLENESSRERMVPRTKVPSWERMFQGTNSLENEYSSIQEIYYNYKTNISCTRSRSNYDVELQWLLLLKFMCKYCIFSLHHGLDIEDLLRPHWTILLLLRWYQKQQKGQDRDRIVSVNRLHLWDDHECTAELFQWSGVYNRLTNNNNNNTTPTCKAP